MIEEDIKLLEKRFVKIKTEYYPIFGRKLNIHSITNIIEFIPRINNTGKQKWTIELINNYFDEIEQLNVEKIDRGKMITLFERHLIPIGKYLSVYFKFYYVSNLNWIFIGFFLDALLFIVGISKNYYYIPIGVLFSFFFHLTRSSYKKSKKLAFGLFY